MVEKIVHPPQKSEATDYSNLEVHDQQGGRYTANYGENWVRGFDASGRLGWTCGRKPAAASPLHIEADLEGPGYLCRSPDGSILVSCFGNHRIYRVVVERQKAEILIDGDACGLKDTGYAVVDPKGQIWVNEVTGCRIWQFDQDGNPVRRLGDGSPGFQADAVPADQARFNWIYDIRVGPDGNLYILDSKNFSLRMLSIEDQVVSCIAGTGSPGYSGDNGDAKYATFGSNPAAMFDGPWAMSLDEEGNVFVADTQNHVVRMIERGTNLINTIAGCHSCQPEQPNPPSLTDPLDLNLPKICGMSYADGRLYLPDYGGELVVLRKSY